MGVVGIAHLERRAADLVLREPLELRVILAIDERRESDGRGARI
jgi:hypothetical protein